jgi:hypothetical protein
MKFPFLTPQNRDLCFSHSLSPAHRKWPGTVLVLIKYLLCASDLCLAHLFAQKKFCKENHSFTSVSWVLQFKKNSFFPFHQPRRYQNAQITPWARSGFNWIFIEEGTMSNKEVGAKLSSLREKKIRGRSQPASTWITQLVTARKEFKSSKEKRSMENEQTHDLRNTTPTGASHAQRSVLQASAQKDHSFQTTLDSASHLGFPSLKSCTTFFFSVHHKSAFHLPHDARFSLHLSRLLQTSPATTVPWCSWRVNVGWLKRASFSSWEDSTTQWPSLIDVSGDPPSYYTLAEQGL